MHCYIILCIIFRFTNCEKLDELIITTNNYNSTNQEEFWEGPHQYEVLIDGRILLPCTKKDKTLTHINILRKQAISEKISWSLLWVHQNWHNVIDPWSGDGRRIYNTWEVKPTLSNKDKQILIGETQLSIKDVDPTDNGVYACLLTTYPVENGISPVNLSKTEIISLHFVRVYANFIMSPECETKKAKYNEMECKTNFEAWTFYRYYLINTNPNHLIFQAPCNADLVLTALFMIDDHPQNWILAWRFVPSNQIDTMKSDQVSDLVQINWVEAKNVCETYWMSTTSTSCTILPKRISHETSTRLAMAYANALKLWTSQWLVLTNSQAHFSSNGKWQCWLRNVKKHSKKLAQNSSGLWLINEIHVKMIAQDHDPKWWSTIELWRVLALSLAPISVGLLFAIPAIAQLAAHIFSHKIPNKQMYTLPFYHPVETGDDNNGLEIDANRKEDENMQNYYERFLSNSGIQSYAPLTYTQADGGNGTIFES